MLRKLHFGPLHRTVKVKARKITHHGLEVKDLGLKGDEARVLVFRAKLLLNLEFAIAVGKGL